MFRFVVFLLAFTAAAAACGGESVRTRNDESGGGATGGASATGGSTTGGTLATVRLPRQCLCQYGGSGCGTHGCECYPNPEGGGYTWSCSGVLC